MSKKPEPIKEEVKVKSKPMEEREDEYEDEDDTPEIQEKTRPKLELPRQEVREEPKQEVKPSQEDLITSEVGILQNNGIYRRELLQNLIGINDSLTLIANVLGKLGGLDK
jgi:hypothetical protein